MLTVAVRACTSAGWKELESKKDSFTAISRVQNHDTLHLAIRAPIAGGAISVEMRPITASQAPSWIRNSQNWVAKQKYCPPAPRPPGGSGGPEIRRGRDTRRPTGPCDDLPTWSSAAHAKVSICCGQHQFVEGTRFRLINNRINADRRVGLHARRKLTSRRQCLPAIRAGFYHPRVSENATGYGT